MGINLEKGVYHCFRCNCAGPVQSLFKKFRIPWRINEGPIPNSLRGTNHPPYPGAKSTHKITGENGILPPSLTLDSEGAKPGLDYLVSRGIDYSTSLNYGITYCNQGHYKDRVILPVIDCGEIVHFQARSIRHSSRHFPKYLNPPIPRGGVLWNLDKAKTYEYVVLVEGIFDGLSVGPHAIALLGKTLTQTQIQMLMSSDIQNAIVLLDKDAIRSACKIAEQLSDIITVKIARLKDKDPDSSSSTEIYRAIHAATLYHPTDIWST